MSHGIYRRKAKTLKTFLHQSKMEDLIVYSSLTRLARIPFVPLSFFFLVRWKSLTMDGCASFCTQNSSERRTPHQEFLRSGLLSPF